MLGRLSGDVSAPQRATHQTVGHQHDQQGEQVDQQYHRKLVTEHTDGAALHLLSYIYLSNVTEYIQNIGIFLQHCTFYFYLSE